MDGGVAHHEDHGAVRQGERLRESDHSFRRKKRSRHKLSFRRWKQNARHVFRPTATATASAPNAASTAMQKVDRTNSDSLPSSTNFCTPAVATLPPTGDLQQAPSKQLLPNTRRTRRIFTWLIFFLSTTVAVAFTALGCVAAFHDQKMRFEKQASELVLSIQSTWKVYEMAALWVQEACRPVPDPTAGGPQVVYNNLVCTREDFRELYRYVSAGGLEFQSMSYIPVIAAHERATLERYAANYFKQQFPNTTLAERYQGFRGFEVPKSSSSKGAEIVMQNRSLQPFYFPNHLIEPMSPLFTGPLWSMVDFDMYSAAIMAQSIDSALTTHQPVISNPVRIASSTADCEHNYVMLLHPGVKRQNTTTVTGIETQTNTDFTPSHDASSSTQVIGVSAAEAQYAIAGNESVGITGGRFSVAQAAYAGGMGLSSMFVEFGALIRLASSGHEPDDVKVYIYDSAFANLRLASFFGAVRLQLIPESNGNTNLRGGSRVRREQEQQSVFSDGSSNQDGNSASVSSKLQFTYDSNDWRNVTDVISYHSSWKSRSYLFQKSIPMELHEWTILVVSSEGAYKPRLSFLLLGGILIFLAGSLLAYWFDFCMSREAAVAAIKESAASERAALMIDSAKDAARIERELNDFMAHEVRNPLAAAMSACSFLQTAHETENLLVDNQQRESIQDDILVVSSSLQYINDLLRSMLDMHKASNRQLKLENVPTDLFKDVLEPVKSILHHKRHDGIFYELFIECPPNLVVETDRMRLKQILLNLANNAKKFVTKGYILIKAEVVKGSVCISVADSGPGISPDKREKLFHKFQESLDSLSQGTGMGLCLCKAMAELMGGDIWLDGSFDSGIRGCRGTRFVVDLKKPPISSASFWDSEHYDGYDVSADFFKPLPNSTCSPEPFAHRNRGERCAPSPSGSFDQATDSGEEGEAPSPTRDSSAITCVREGDTETLGQKLESVQESLSEDESALPRECSVLVVDDDLMLRKLITRSLLRVAPTWQIQEASNGETAVVMACSQNFDLIFMDQYMASVEKQMLGTETVMALRAKGVSSRICGLSANDIGEAFLQAGADAFVQKPFPCKKQELCNELYRILFSSLGSP